MTLRQFREKKGLSQAELGNRVGLKQTTISQYFKDTHSCNG